MNGIVRIISKNRPSQIHHRVIRNMAFIPYLYVPYLYLLDLWDTTEYKSNFRVNPEK